MVDRAEVEAQLLGPGGMFEVVPGSVGGVAMKVYKDRLPSLRAVFELGTARGDEQTFVVHGTQRYGFATFAELANRVSARLSAEAGVGHGDRVAVLSANNPQWCLAFWGTVNLGAILVGLNGWWKADEILYGLADSGAKVLVADRGRIARIADRLDELTELEVIYLIDAEPAEIGDDPRLRRFDELTGAAPTDVPATGDPAASGGPAAPGAAAPGAPGRDSASRRSATAITSTGTATDPAATSAPTTAIAEADPAVIFYTSGTTGKPKGAISTHGSMIANLQNTMFNAMAGSMSGGGGVMSTGGGRPPASLLTSPLFHVSGCHSGLVVGLLAGLKLVIPEGRFDPEGALRLIQDEGVTVWATVPTMVWRVVEHPARHDYDVSSVTSVAYGGSPSAAELQRRIQETFPNVTTIGNAYGLTESSSVATVISGQDALDRPASVGRPMPVVDLRIVSPDGADVPAGSTGEVWIRGPIIMPGYWGKPEATAETVTEGWLHTGDLGHLDGDGFLFITDRAKDMIIRGGENIYCVEIENRLVEHPSVADAAIVGVAHPTLGEEVKAVVQVEPGAELTEAEVRSWVAEALADFKVPAHVELVQEKLPRNASGKLLKNVLRGEGEVSFAETM